MNTVFVLCIVLYSVTIQCILYAVLYSIELYTIKNSITGSFLASSWTNYDVHSNY